MDNKTTTWLWTGGVAAVTGVATLYYRVRKAAIEHLNMHGFFDGAIRERTDALRQLPITADGKPVTQDMLLPVDDNTAIAKGTHTENVAVQRINQKFMNRKRDIVRRYGADNFSGAWNVLSPNEKTGAVEFSAVTSIVAGGLTYALAHTAQKPSRGGGKGGRDNNSCGACGYGGGGHHGCSGHGCGHGCGGGCGH